MHRSAGCSTSSSPSSARRSSTPTSTETAREADALAETDQVRTALLSAVSHDLRRPLAAAVAAIGGLRAAGDNAVGRTIAASCSRPPTRASARCPTLVTDLLDVSRVQAGVLAVSLRPVDAADVVLAALDELRSRAGRGRPRAGPRRCRRSLADPVLLQRVLVNVLANADRATPRPARRVRVTTSQSRRDPPQIRIIDHGPGIPADRRDDVFAPFQRLGDTDNTAGLGLGLALSKGFTEGMGGTLTPEDTPGGGLTMVIALPVAADDGGQP